MTVGPMFPKPTPRPKERSQGLKRHHMKAKPPRRLEGDKNDTSYRRFVVSLGCVVKGMPGATKCRGPIQAAHLTLSANEKGVGTKVADRQCVGMCSGHHDEWDGRDRSAKSTFFGLSKPDRYERARIWVAETQLAATPEDHDQALHFQEIGLGRWEEDGSRWVPGPAREEAA